MLPTEKMISLWKSDHKYCMWPNDQLPKPGGCVGNDFIVVGVTWSVCLGIGFGSYDFGLFLCLMNFFVCLFALGC